LTFTLQKQEHSLVYLWDVEVQMETEKQTFSISPLFKTKLIFK